MTKRKPAGTPQGGQYDYETPRGKNAIPKPAVTVVSVDEALAQHIAEKTKKQSQIQEMYIRYYQQINPDLTAEEAAWMDYEVNMLYWRKTTDPAYITPAKYKALREAWKYATPPVLAALSGVANGNIKAGYSPENWSDRVVTYATRNPDLAPEIMVATLRAEIEQNNGTWGSSTGQIGLRLKLAARKHIPYARRTLSAHEGEYAEVRFPKTMEQQEEANLLTLARERIADDPHSLQADILLQAVINYQDATENPHYTTRDEAIGALRHAINAAASE